MPGESTWPRLTRRLGRPVALALGRFLVFGWWMALLSIVAAWSLSITVVGLPLAARLLNLLPKLLLGDLRKAKNERSAQEVFVWRTASIKQRPWLLRALYLLVVGWWASLLWAFVAWLMCATILGLPLGILMLSWLPSVATLVRTE